jgi:dihydroorotate dehydrogenase (NAD+) catalytic subunit
MKPRTKAPDLAVDVGPLHLSNPVMVASGTFGALMDTVLDVSKLGAVVEKTVTRRPRKGNPPPRVWETPSGMLNSIGLENYGLEGWIQKRYPEVKDYPCALIVSVSGETVEEYGELVAAIDRLPRVDAFELNISCPNVSHGLDHATDPASTERVVRIARAATRRPIFAKLTPNVSDIGAVAAAAMEGGADGLSLVNTLKGIAIDWRRRIPCLGAVTGGLSGPAIKPVALRMVWEVCGKLPKAPVIGIGGISNADDALEFMVAGARAVQVGTANFVDAQTGQKIVDALRERLATAGIPRISDLIGSVIRPSTVNRQPSS